MEKAFARAALRAMQIRQESFLPLVKYADDCSTYAKTLGQCAREAMTECGVSDGMYLPLTTLLLFEWNDIPEWAAEVLRE